jgi:hypothetical protein
VKNAGRNAQRARRKEQGAKSKAQRARRNFSFVFGEFGFIEHRATSTFEIPFGYAQGRLCWIFDIPFSFSSRFQRIRIHRTSTHFNIQNSVLDIRYSFFFFISFSENLDSSNIAPLQHSKFSIGYSIFLFLLHLVFREFGFFEHRATSTFRIRDSVLDIRYSFFLNF